MFNCVGTSWVWWEKRPGPIVEATTTIDLIVLDIHVGNLIHDGNGLGRNVSHARYFGNPLDRLHFVYDYDYV